MAGHRAVWLIVAAILVITGRCASGSAGLPLTGAAIAGTWSLLPAYNGTNSSTVPLLYPSTVTLGLSTGGDEYTVTREWADAPTGGDVVVRDTLQGATKVGAQVPSPPTSRVWAYNVFIGVEFDTFSSTSRVVTTTAWDAAAGRLEATAATTMLAAQGGFAAREQHAFQVVAPDVLRYTVTSTAPALNAVFYYARGGRAPADWPAEPQPQPDEESAEAVVESTAQPSVAPTSGDARYNLALADNWTLTSSDMQLSAMVISLQGLVNRDGARLYLTYPDDWAYDYTPMVRDYFALSQNFTFSQLQSPAEALSKLAGGVVKGYVVWDPEVRESLVVAFTAAGVGDGIVVTQAQVPMAAALGVPMLANLTGLFRGWTPVEIYSWAKDRYWADCTREMILWMGGSCPTTMHPGVADYGVGQRAFFTDLNTNTSSVEYPLADQLVGEMAAAHSGGAMPPLLMGWHSYCKDAEHTFTTLASKHGGRVHGLNTNPNLSFASKLKLPAGYEFHNRHSPPAEVTPPAPRASNPTTYITLVQTDGLGLGAWAKPGRGTVPYAWEVTLPDLWIQPVLLQMFYEQATDKDFFVGALGGPGYMYPKAVPPQLLPARLQLAQEAMRILDLHHFVIFDASDTHGQHTVTGDCCLTVSSNAPCGRRALTGTHTRVSPAFSATG